MANSFIPASNVARILLEEYWEAQRRFGPEVLEIQRHYNDAFNAQIETAEFCPSLDKSDLYHEEELTLP